MVPKAAAVSKRAYRLPKRKPEDLFGRRKSEIMDDAGKMQRVELPPLRGTSTNRPEKPKIDKKT